MRNFLLLLTLLFTSIVMQADPVEYKGCIPENGSTISSFNFTLNFDVDKAIQSLGEGEWGLGYLGNIPNGTYAALYKGSQEDGVELAKTLTENFTGKSKGFTLNSNTVNISFPVSLLPEPGQTYTLVITNTFSIFQSGKTVAKAVTSLKYKENPLVLTFVGGMPTSSEIVIKDVSISDNSKLDKLNEVKYTFNEPIIPTVGAKVSIFDGAQIVYESSEMSVSSTDINTLVVKFDDNVILYSGHDYRLVLSANSVSLKSDNQVSNKEYIINIEGASYRYYTVNTTSPQDGAIGLFKSASISYNIPQGAQISVEGISADFYIKLYKNEIADENYIRTFYGKQTDDKSVITWDLSDFPYEPSTNYVLYRAEGLGKLYGDNADYSEWTNEESIIHFSTPSVAEAGLAPMEWQAPVLGQHGKDAVFVPGQKINNIQNIELALKDLKYDYNGIANNVVVAPNAKFYVYEITDDGNTLIAEDNISTQTRENSTSYYSVVKLIVNRTFYTGKKYKIVIPAGALTVTNPMIQNYVKNSEWSFEFDGGSPTTAKLISCTIQNNAELCALPVIIWEFEGEFVQNPELSAIRITSYELMGKPIETKMNVSTITSSTNNATRVAMLNYDYNTGDPFSLSTSRRYEVVLPEGIIYLADDPNIKNDELRYTIIPVEAQSNEKTEFVNLSVSINGLATASQKTVKGQPIVVTLTPSTDWKVVKLTRNGNSVIDFIEDGSYETPALTEDTAIEARIEYDGLWAVESTTGVWEISDSKISIYSEDGHIVVSGATHDNQILVYGVNGTLIKSVTPDANTDVTTISVEPGNIYIVIVDGIAAKLQL